MRTLYRRRGGGRTHDELGPFLYREVYPSGDLVELLFQGHLILTEGIFVSNWITINFIDVLSKEQST